ncbi:MAG TPA: bifunctional oligoribonuclease/PAP phosphatase NrnA [Victivallales bacterium]|nr:bifunctional oligoribonuclease/PAP phosphatase NrnA [Victivallales bacterium]
MTVDNTREISEHIYLSNRFLIITHCNPDGDAIGSSMAFLKLLKDNGKKADFYIPHRIPLKYEKLIEENIITGNLPDLSEYSTMICLDSSNPLRANLPPDIKIDKLGIFTINIDHHPDNKLFGNLNLVKANASSTAEVIYDFAKFANLKISPKTAEYILIGILSDTGGLRFDNTNADLLRLTADLVDYGVDYVRTMRLLFFSKPLPLLKLEGEIIEKRLKSECSGKFIYAILDEKLFSKYNVPPGESEGLIDIIKCVEGSYVVAFIYENSDGYRVSLRSTNNKISVGKIARALGGGGHELAAGTFIRTKSASEAEQILLSQVKKELQLSPFD